MLNLAQAISIAAEAHSSQTDKQGQPYILHCLEVMRGVEKYNDEELSTIAVLHDLIEDTEWENIELDGVFFLTLNGNHIQISTRVSDALLMLTHIKDVPYTRYINMISTNQDAIRVKMSDLEHNSQIFRLKGVTDKDLARMEKYHKAYIALKEALN
jgi:(p)ppGpp synthase/HD superfamily hydrolase